MIQVYSKVIHILQLYIYTHIWASLVAQMVKNLFAMQKTRVRSLGWEDPLEEEMATHPNILTWEIPWTEKGYSPFGYKESDMTEQQTNFYTYIYSLSDSFPLYVITRYWVEFRVLSSRSLLFVYFIYNSVYLFIPYS